MADVVVDLRHRDLCQVASWTLSALLPPATVVVFDRLASVELNAACHYIVSNSISTDKRTVYSLVPVADLEGVEPAPPPPLWATD